MFEYGPVRGGSPQIWGLSSVHTLGTVKLSRLLPQARRLILHHPRSAACGFVGIPAPQLVDESSVHSLWVQLSTGGPQVLIRCPQLLHTPVHCSATKRPRSPDRVKAVTRRGRVGLWGTWVKLGTALGRSTPVLCIGCAELSGVHRNHELSTGSTHRGSGQKSGCDLRKRGYPRFPQPLLLLPHRVSSESVSKWGLCTTGRRSSWCRSTRLDPDSHRLSAAYVRLVPGDTADDESQQGEPATAGGGFR